ncbi:MAG TPA: M1 family metallopeptidase [Pyrinomonadaceae bacterium]|jgi:leukotriene A-4 hydrolase/aminopeptidase|nr:M1 family metallopeptidase [Pyrinomonadaceae bacterium]
MQRALATNTEFDNSHFAISPTVRVVQDNHSFSNPAEVRVRHIDLDLSVSFEEKKLHGTAVLSFDKLPSAQRLILDTLDLDILAIEVSPDGVSYFPAAFSLAEADPILGAALTIDLPNDGAQVKIEYVTTPFARALQWLEPQQTAGKKSPFLLTQSETIQARSWIPLQDTPQVRVTYQAKVQTPPELMAVMSAANNPQSPRQGTYEFVMMQPIPSYLIALAVGALEFKSLGPRTGVYAESPVVALATTEFADIERMMEATEKLYGPYLWDRYDILVLPPSFPLGGMENPRMTFATPTILAGDKSLVSLIAHELAHSWSGNLVTNATWRDFWLNEGFAVYVERRILEELYGRDRAEMEAVLGHQDLLNELATLEDEDEILYLDLKGRDPEECFTRIPYEKGALFLRQLEEIYGRARFDAFLRDYFEHFAFQSITTAVFLEYLNENLLAQAPQLSSQVPVEEWLYKPGLPLSAPQPKSEAFIKVEKQAEDWIKGAVSIEALEVAAWSTHEWLHFLTSLPKTLEGNKLSELDQRFQLTNSNNSEIAHQWLLIAIRNHYQPAYARLQEFLITTGRGKLIKPLYEELINSGEGKQMAAAIYAKGRPGYHPLVVRKLDRLFRPDGQHL